MKSIRRILTLLFLVAVGLTTWVAAQEDGQLLIDSGRNAVLHFKKTDKAKGLDGGFGLAGDFAKGLSTLKADFKFGPEVQKEVGDGSGGFYLSLGSSAEVVGTIDIPLPENAKAEAPKKADLQFESAMSEAKGYAKGTLNVIATVPQAVPQIDINGNWEGGAKNLTGKTTFSFDMGAKAKDVPLKSFAIELSEKDALSTIKIKVAMDAKNPASESLKQMAKSPDQVQNGIKQNLAAAGIEVEKVEISEFKDTPDVSATLTIILKDWRKTVSGKAAQAGAYQKLDAEKLKAGVTKCLEMKINSFAINLALEGSTVKGSVDGNLDNLNALFTGYYDIVGQVMEAQAKGQDEEADFAKKFGTAYQAVAMEDAKKVFQVMGESDVKHKGDFKVVIAAPADKDGKVGDLKADGSFNMTIDNLKSYWDKAAAAGLPVGKSSAAKFTATLADARVKGSLYAFNDTKMLDYHKRLLVETLKRAGAPAEQVKLAEGITLNGGQFAATLSKDGLTAAGFGESSPLTPVVKAIAMAADKNFSGEPSGFSVSGKTEKEQMNIEAKIFFAKLFEGKSAADVKAAMGVDVKEGAKPEEVKLVAVEKPEVKMPQNLVAIQEDGKKLLGQSIATSMPSLPGAGTAGKSNMMLIFGGLLAALVVGAGIAAGRKKG